MIFNGSRRDFHSTRNRILNSSWEIRKRYQPMYNPYIDRMLIHIVDFQIKTSRNLITGIFCIPWQSAFDLPCMDYTWAGRRFPNPTDGYSEILFRCMWKYSDFPLITSVKSHFSIICFLLAKLLEKFLLEDSRHGQVLGEQFSLTYF